MKLFAYFLMVLYIVFGIALFGIFSLILWWVTSWQNHKIRILSDALHRNRVAAAIFGGLILAVLGASLVATIFAAFPEYSCSYEGVISFFIFWLVGIDIALRIKSAPKT